MTRDRKRIAKILHIVYQIWNKNPDLRLFQLLMNSLKAEEINNMFYLEDNVIYARLGEFYDKLQNQTESKL